LLASGERRAALALALALPARGAGGHLRQLTARLETELVRARGVTLRLLGGATSLRVAAVPARLGRDPLAEVTLRDPGVSRHHAVIGADAAGLFIEDAGSRGGVLVAGARATGRFALRGEGELGIGLSTSFRFQATPDGRTVVLRGLSGLDRELVVLAGHDPIDLALAIPGARGLALELAAGGARLVRRPDRPVRVGGHLVGPGCDLLHGDLVEVLGDAPLALEVA
jgi:hypothetical protein